MAGNIPPPNTPLVDQRGNITPEWYRWLSRQEAILGPGTVIAGDGLEGGGSIASGVELSIADQGVTDAMLRDSAACSVIGRFQNSAGPPTDIRAMDNDRVLMRLDDQLVFKELSNTLVGSEPAVTAGTTAQYYRGDKTWQTLNGLAVANTPAGNIAAVTVQAAINELDSEKQPLDATLSALAAFNTNGFLVQTAADTFAGRTLAAPAAGITITNPAGTAGNPTFALANDLAALEALSGTNTIYYRSGVDTWTAVTIGPTLSFSAGTLAVVSAPILTTARTISITGKATSAGGTFDGSGNLALNVTAVTLIAADIPNIAESQVTGLTADLAAKANLAGGQAFTGGMTTDTFYASTRVRVGYNTALTYRAASNAAANVANQIVSTGTAAQDAMTVALRNIAGASAGYRWAFARSENGTTGLHTAISTTTSDLGKLLWTGSDGTDFRDAAAILGFVNNTTVNASGFEGRLEFQVGAPSTGVLTKYASLDPTTFAVTGAISATSTISGTNLNAFTAFSGPATSTKTFALPNASATILTDNAAVTAAQGGTGIASYAVGDILYASASTTLSKLAGVATGNVLISGGVTTAPSWGKVGLTTHVSGTLPVANGGTGITSLGTGIATFLGTPTSANLAAALTDESGSGLAMFGTAKTAWPSAPRIAIGGSSTGITYTAQDGYYVKIGDVVVVSIRIILSSKGAGSGAVTIENLPFTVGANGSGPVLVLNPANPALATCIPNNATTQILLYAATSSQLQASDITNTTSFYITTPYLV